MTENEAIEYLEFLKTKLHTNGYNDRCVDVAIKVLEEIQQYRALGTVEELREAREKQRAKKMKDRCPDCGTPIKRCYFNCPGCGQAIDWQ